MVPPLSRTDSTLPSTSAKRAAALEDRRGILGLVDDIIRFGPQAKLGGARRLLVAQQRPRAGRVADARRNPRLPRPHEFRLQPALGAVLADEHMRHEAAVAVGLERAEPLQHDLARRREARIRRETRIFGQFDPGEADHAAVVEREPASVAPRTLAPPMVTKRQPSCARTGVTAAITATASAAP